MSLIFNSTVRAVTTLKDRLVLMLSSNGRGGQVKKLEKNNPVFTFPDKPETFSAPAREFLGWSLSGAKTTEPEFIPGDTLETNEDLNLYSVWSESKNVIVYNFLDDDNQTKEILEAAKIHAIIPDVPVKTGYTFLGWSKVPFSDTELYNSGDEIDLGAETAVTLFAIYNEPVTSIPPYKVIFKAGHGKGDDVEMMTNSQGKITLPADIFSGWQNPDGYINPLLGGWSVNLDLSSTINEVTIGGRPEEEITLHGDCILFANFVEGPTCKIYWHPMDATKWESLEGAHSIFPETDPAQVICLEYPYGSEQFLAVDPWGFEDYAFKGWVANLDDDTDEPKYTGTSIGRITEDLHFYSVHVRAKPY